MQPWKPDFDISGLGKELYIVGLTPPVNKKKLGLIFCTKYTEILDREKLIFGGGFFFMSEKRE